MTKIRQVSGASLVLAGLISGSLLFGGSNASAGDAAKGKVTYDSKCAKCHGKTGNGDGPNADLLAVKPRKFSDPAFFTDKEGMDMPPDERMALAISKGGTAIKKSKLMQGFPQLSADDIQDVIAYMKTIAGK